MAATMMAQYELAALFHQREMGLPMWPTMEESFLALPALRAGLDQALSVKALLEAYPELASHIPPGGVPQQQEQQ